MIRIKTDIDGFLPSKAIVGNRILSRSLMWFGGAITFVLLFAFAVLNIPALKEGLGNFVVDFFGRIGWIGFLLVMIGFAIINFLAYFTVIRRSLSIPFVVLASLFALVVLLDTWLVVFSFLYVDQARGMEGVLVMISIPMVATLLLGILGYFQMINFNKLLPVILVLGLALLVSSIVGFFIMNRVMDTLISSLGILFYLLYMGWIFYSIKMEEKYLSEIPIDYWSRNNLEQDDIKVVNAVINRASLAYGLLLFISFVRLLYYIARFMGRK